MVEVLNGLVDLVTEVISPQLARELWIVVLLAGLQATGEDARVVALLNDKDSSYGP